MEESSEIYGNWVLNAPPRDLKARLRFTFQDRNGTHSTRTVQMKSYAWNGSNGGVEGFCEMRGARRFFSMARISSPVCMDTGESISDLPAWLEASFLASPQGEADGFLNVHGDAMTLLLAAAIADFAVRKKDKEVLGAFMDAHGLAPAARDYLLSEMPKWGVVHGSVGRCMSGLLLTSLDYRLEVVTGMRAMLPTSREPTKRELQLVERVRVGLKLGKLLPPI